MKFPYKFREYEPFMDKTRNRLSININGINTESDHGINTEPDHGINFLQGHHYPFKLFNNKVCTA